MIKAINTSPILWIFGSLIAICSIMFGGGQQPTNSKFKLHLPAINFDSIEFAQTAQMQEIYTHGFRDDKELARLKAEIKMLKDLNNSLKAENKELQVYYEKTITWLKMQK